MQAMRLRAFQKGDSVLSSHYQWFALSSYSVNVARKNRRNKIGDNGKRVKLLEKQSKEEWVAQYSESHQNRANRLCHLVGIPMIALSLPLFIPILFFREWWPLPTAMFLLGWILQFVGHAFEGKPPEFFKDWRFLFVGLRWWFAKVRGDR
jgi:hypothetical protein